MPAPDHAYLPDTDTKTRRTWQFDDRRCDICERPRTQCLAIPPTISSHHFTPLRRPDRSTQ